MFSILQQKAKIIPNDAYIIFKGQEYTFSDIYDNSGKIANYLSKNGIRAGDIVGVLLPTGIDFVYLIYALMKLRAILVPLNTRLTVNELKWQTSLVDCKTIVYNSEYKKLVCQLTNSTETVNLIDFDSMKIEDNEESVEFSSLKGDNSLTQCIMFTSGTTESPKGVILSYSNHLAHFEGHADRIPMREGDRWLNCIPLYHIGGLQIILRCLIFGMPVVLHQRFVIDEIINSIYKDKVTIISLVPTMLERILKKSELQNSSLRCILLGGAKTTLDLINKSLRLNLPICTTYGMTESNSQVCTILTEDLKQKPESVGKPIFGLNIMIVNDSNENLGKNIIGEICTRGSSIAKGYYNQDTLSSHSFLDDYFKTGDLGFIDEDGDLFVIQRRIDLIISGGENVYPSEVENILLQHDSIRNAVVFGEEDSDLGQIVTAALIIDSVLIEQDIIDFCRKFLAAYKIPRKYYVLSKFEETSSGKIIRQKVIDNTKNAQKI